MALATQCPHCGTTFRVAHDQLKLRAGLVRCGACKEIFNGIEHLLHAAEPASAGPQPESGTAATPPPAPGTDHGGAGILPPTSMPEPEPEPETTDSDATDADTEAPQPAPFSALAPTDPDSPDHDRGAGNGAGNDMAALSTYPPPAMEDADSAAYDPLQRMTLMDFARGEEAAADTFPDTSAQRLGADSGNGNGDDSDASEDSDELDRAIDALKHKPLRRRSRAKAKAPAEPDFIARARKQQHGSGIRRALLAGASVLLLLAALAQGAYAFRNQLAALLPQVKPLLALGCGALDCRIDLPKQIDSVTIESSELQALAPEKNTFALSVLLRNRSSTIEAWPDIELTLNDASEQPLVRRVFRPRDYLPAAQNEAEGFAANTEQPLRMYFELATPKAAGYRIYLFYS
jgi:predicted Zn finger-like uncharacterized protein